MSFERRPGHLGKALEIIFDNIRLISSLSCILYLHIRIKVFLGYFETMKNNPNYVRHMI